MCVHVCVYLLGYVLVYNQSCSLSPLLTIAKLSSYCILPGSMPRSMDVVLRHAAVDKAKAGDKCTFNGSLVVVPDVRQLLKAGTVPTSHSRSEGGAGAAGAAEGFTGLKALGVRDLTYRTSFLASYVTQTFCPQLPSSACWLLVVGCWLLVVGCWSSSFVFVFMFVQTMVLLCPCASLLYSRLVVSIFAESIQRAHETCCNYLLLLVFSGFQLGNNGSNTCWGK